MVAHGPITLLIISKGPFTNYQHAASCRTKFWCAHLVWYAATYGALSLPLLEQGQLPTLLNPYEYAEYRLADRWSPFGAGSSSICFLSHDFFGIHSSVRRAVDH